MSTPPSPSSPPRFGASDLAMLGVVLAWGSNYALVKEAIAVLPPLAFMALRFTLAALAMGVVLLAREGWRPLPRATFLKLAALGFVGNTLYQLCFVLGMAHTTAANSGLLSAVTPVLVAALSAALGIEPLRRTLVAGLVLAVAGMLLVVGARGPSLSEATLLGDGLILLGSVCWSVYTVGVRPFGVQVSALRLTAVTMLAGAPGLALVGLPAVVRLEFAPVPALAWVALAYSALVPLVVCYVVWNQSVRSVGPGRTALYNAGIPVAAALTAWAARGERPTLVQGAGAGLILAGVLLTRRR